LSQNLPSIIKDIFTPSVTASLPPAWHGPYSVERARNWIRERDAEGATMLIVEKESMTPLGLVILFDMTEEHSKSKKYYGCIKPHVSSGNVMIVLGSLFRCGFVQE
jgi:hypothetical protein